MNQMQRTFGLILILFFLVDSQQIIQKNRLRRLMGRNRLNQVIINIESSNN